MALTPNLQGTGDASEVGLDRPVRQRDFQPAPVVAFAPLLRRSLHTPVVLHPSGSESFRRVRVLEVHESTIDLLHVRVHVAAPLVADGVGQAPRRAPLRLEP